MAIDYADQSVSSDALTPEELARRKTQQPETTTFTAPGQAPPAAQTATAATNAQPAPPATTQQPVTAQWNAPTTMPAPTATAAPVTVQPMGGVRDPRWNELYGQLQARSNQSLKVDPTDPVIKAQVDAASVAANREAQRAQQAAVERGGSYGTGLAANSLRMLKEGVGTKIAGVQAELMSREVAARREEIQAALNGMFGVLSEDEKSRLAQEDAGLRAQQISLQGQGLAEQKNQNAWERAFRDREWEAALAQQNWQNEQSMWG